MSLKTKGMAKTLDQLAPGYSRAAVEEIARRRQEPDWLRLRRLAAWEVYEAIPWPGPKDEEWRRFDLREIPEQAYRPLAPAGERLTSISQLPVAVRTLLIEKSRRGGLVVSQNSAGVYTELAPALVEQGVILTDIETAIRQYGDLVREHFMTTCIRPEESKFLALHAACWSGGAFIYIPPGVEVTQPLQAVVYGEGEDVSFFPHTLVILGRGARLTLVTDYVSAPGKSVAIPVVEGFIGEGARLQYVTLQNWSELTVDYGYQRLIQERESYLDWLMAVLGSKKAHPNAQTLIKGVGAGANLLGVMIGHRDQDFDIHTLQDHIAGQTESDLLFKGALRDTARSLFQGLVIIRPGAKQTNAYQENRNLLLSSKARADSNPVLEIQSNDVRCKHGATVGEIDKEHLFYLMARGIHRQDAIKIVVDGFFQDVLGRFPDERGREHVGEALQRKLASGGPL